MCRLLCCVSFQSGCLWWRWHLAVYYSCCWLGFVGVSVVLTPAAVTSAAGAAPTHAAARDTVSINTHSEMWRVRRKAWMSLRVTFFLFFSIRGRKRYKDGHLHPSDTCLPSVLCHWGPVHGPHCPSLPGGEFVFCPTLRWQPTHSRWGGSTKSLKYFFKFGLKLFILD